MPFVTPERATPNVRFGSKADIALGLCNVRSTAENGHGARVERSCLVASLCLSRTRERLHSAVPNRFGGARGGKKFDQSFRTFNVS